MLEKINQSQPELRDLCRRYRVRRLEVFGSAARQDFGPSSDLDFLVEFEVMPELSGYFGLKENLESLFGRPVDLVMPRAVRNPYVLASMNRDRQVVYAA